MSIGSKLIAEERWSQESKDGWTAAHDDEHTNSELAEAAIAYAMHGSVDWPDADDIWPFDAGSWRPSGNRVKNLVKAGALIAAEIDRLLRKDGFEDTKYGQEG